MTVDKVYKRFAGHSVQNAGYHNFNWDLFHAGNEIRDVSFSSLKDAITEIGSSSKNLYITKNHRLTSNMVIPSNVSVIAIEGGTIDQGSFSCTINGPFDAGLHKVFLGSGTVTFNAITRVYPQWFKAEAGGTVNCTTPFQYAANSISSRGGRVNLTAGVWLVSGTVNVPAGVCFDGVGEYAVCQVTGGGASNIVFQLNGSDYHQHSYFQDFNIHNCGVCIDASPSAFNGSSFVTYNRMRFSSFSVAGLRYDAGNDNTGGTTFSGHNLVTNCTFAGSGGGSSGTGTGISIQGIVTTFTIRDSSFFSMQYGIRIKGGTMDTIHILNNSIEDCSLGHIIIDNSSGFGYAAASLLYRTASIAWNRFESGLGEVGATAVVSVVNGAVVEICHNDFQNATTVNGRGTIEVDSYDCIVAENMIWNNASAGSSSYGVWLKSNSTRCRVYGNISPLGNTRPPIKIQDDGTGNIILREITTLPTASASTVEAFQYGIDSNIVNTKVGLKVCAVAGTNGSLGAVTGNVVNGRNYIENVSSLTNLLVDQRLNIAGAGTEYRITYIDSVTSPNRVYILPVYGGATANGVSLAWQAPDIRTMPTMFSRGGITVLFVGDTQAIGFSASAPSSGAWNQGDIIWNTNQGTSQNLGWVCTVAGTPGTWVVFGWRHIVTGSSTFSVANVAGSAAQFLSLLDAGSNVFRSRWGMGRNGDAESGSNAGSNWDLVRYDDNGNQLAVNLTVNRANGDWQFEDAIDFILGSTTGHKWGTAASQKQAWYGATPIVQPASANQAAAAAQTQNTLTDSTTGTADTTVQDVGAVFSQSTLNNNFADLVSQLNKIKADVAAVKTLQDQTRTDLVALGFQKGSA